MKINFDNCSAQPISIDKFTCVGCPFIDYIPCPGAIIPWICRSKVFSKCEKSDIFNL